MSGRGNRKGATDGVLQSLESIVKAASARLEETEQEDEAGGEEEVETADDGMGIVETYAEYWPSKLKIGKKHPDPVVCTASLTSVESADINYSLKLPENIIDNGLLSALQLEAVCYAAQAHERHLQDKDSSRAGFLIGDGAGVGKGRTIAGIIYENFLHNRKKAVWISVSNDLKYDAERDFLDIGANKISVHPLNKCHYNARISSSANGGITSGVLFCTYASLIGKANNIGKFNTRMAQIIDWCGKDFDGCIVFDECHKAKNLIPVSSLKPTLTGKAVVELQSKLPNARVVYSSATGASEPRNMGYMVRLGLWGVKTAFRTFDVFEKTVQRRGVGAMEVVAMDMKLRGMYVARQLSFQGVTFRVEKVPLTEEFIRMYDESVALWNLALKYFNQAAYLMNVDANMSKVIFGQFWGAHQRFFKYLAIAAKVDYTVNLTIEAVKAGKCVVIGLQSTGEARTLDELDKNDGELDDYISTAKAVFESLVERQFPALDRNVSNSENESDVKVAPSTSRKRKAPSSSQKPKLLNVTKRPRRNVKRKRFTISSDEDEDVNSFDSQETSEKSCSEDEYKPSKNAISSDESSDYEDVKTKIKKYEKMDVSESDSEDEDSSDEAEEEINDLSTPSEVSDSDSGENKVTNGKSKVKISKVQEYLIKRYRDTGKASKNDVKDQRLKNDIIEGMRKMKDELLQHIEDLGERLPKNTLDDLINKLGGSEKVAEMTGRKGRVAGMTNGTVQYESRSETGISMEVLNIKEKERFMNGDKLIAIISEAASSGISLQSDRRVKNQLKRLHITLELPWAADQAIQQFGRTHRSNQVNAPEYVFLISELAGEQRFVATVARRLESLGALTHADRRATQTRDLSEFHIDNKHGRKALASTIHAINKLENPIVPPPEDYRGDFFADVHKALRDVGLDLHAMADVDRKSDNIVRFLNRSLGVPVHLQNCLFRYFSDTLCATILKARKELSFEQGLVDIGQPERVTRTNLKRFFHRHATGVSPVELHTVRVDRGVTWEEALEKSKPLTKEHEGFYISREAKAKAILVIRLSDNDTQPPNLMMLGIVKPHTGPSRDNESLEQIRRTYDKTTPEKAQKHWIYQYEFSVDRCSHLFLHGKCAKSIFAKCEYGIRITTRVVLSGSVLGVWDRVEKQLRGGEDGSGQFVRMQVCRLRTNDGRANNIGILVPNECVSELSNELAEDAESIEEVDLTKDLKPNVPKTEVKVEQEITTKIEAELKSELEVKTKVEPKIEPDADSKME